MKIFFQNTRSVGIAEKCDPSSSEGSDCSQTLQKDKRKMETSFVRSKTSSLGRWKNRSNGMSLVTTPSTARNSMRDSRRLKQDRLVSDVVDEVLNFEKHNSFVKKKNEKFSQNFSTKGENVSKVHISTNHEFVVPIAVNGERDQISKTQRDIVNIETVRSEDSSLNLKNPINLDKEVNKLILTDMLFTENDDNTIINVSHSSDEESSHELKKGRFKSKSETDSADSFSTELIAQPEIKENPMTRVNILEIDTNFKKVVIAELKTAKFLTNIIDAQKVLTSLIGLEFKSFNGLTINRQKEAFVFLIYEDALNEYLKNPYDSKICSLKPWGCEDININIATTTLVCINAINAKSPDKGIRKAGKKLLRSLLGNEKELDVSRFIFSTNIVNNDKNLETSKITGRIKDGEKLLKGKKGEVRNKSKVASPFMSKEEKRKEELFNILQNFFANKSASTEKRKTEVPRSTKNVTSHQEKEKLISKCIGESKPEVRVVLAEVITPARIDSFHDIKQVLVSLFGLKASEFAGLTKSKVGNAFTFLVEEKALERYDASPQNLRAGSIIGLTKNDAMGNIPMLATICEKIASNCNSKTIKRAAKELLKTIEAKPIGELKNFITGVGDRSYNESALHQ